MPARFHPSLGIPLITTVALLLLRALALLGFHPSLGIPLITTPVQCPAPVYNIYSFHPSLGIPLITTIDAMADPHTFTDIGFHPSLGIPLITTKMRRWVTGGLLVFVSIPL